MSWKRIQIFLSLKVKEIRIALVDFLKWIGVGFITVISVILAWTVLIGIPAVVFKLMYPSISWEDSYTAGADYIITILGWVLLISILCGLVYGFSEWIKDNWKKAGQLEKLK